MEANRAAIYTRISTGEQNSDLQTTELPEFCARRGWHLAEIYSDVMTEAKDKRPALDRLMADAKARKVFGRCRMAFRSICEEHQPPSAGAGGILISRY